MPPGRAGGRWPGERCGRPHGREVLHLGDGLWWGDEAHAWRCGAGKPHRRLPAPHSTILPMRRTRVFLSACHLDHDPTNNEAANLAARYQGCPLLNDAPEQRRRRAVTMLTWRACGDLLSEPYG